MSVTFSDPKILNLVNENDKDGTSFSFGKPNRTEPFMVTNVPPPNILNMDFVKDVMTPEEYASFIQDWTDTKDWPIIIEDAEIEEEWEHWLKFTETKEARINFQASQPPSGGMYLVPRYDINWDAIEVVGEGWEDMSELRHNIIPVIQGEVLVPEKRPNSVPITGKYDPIKMKGVIDSQNRFIIDGNLSHNGRNYYTAETPVGKAYIDLKFTKYLPKTKDEKFTMVCRMKETDHACPLKVVRIL